MEPRFLVSVNDGADDDRERQVKRLELLRRVEAQTGEASDQGEYVRVSVDSSGRVSSLWLDERLASTPLDKLAPHIAAVCAKAFDERLTQISRLVAANTDLLDPATADSIAAMADRLGKR